MGALSWCDVCRTGLSWLRGVWAVPPYWACDGPVLVWAASVGFGSLFLV